MQKPKTLPEFFALLASTDPAGVSARDRQRLFDYFTRLVPLPPSFHPAQLPFFRDDVLPGVHRDAWKWIRTLVTGGSVRPDPHQVPPVTWHLSDGELREDYPAADEHTHRELVATIRTTPFPYRLCPVCDRVFVRAGKRRWCSTVCSQRQADSQRDKDARREYMRDLMRKRRQKAARARKKATPR